MFFSTEFPVHGDDLNDSSSKSFMFEHGKLLLSTEDLLSIEAKIRLYFGYISESQR